MNEASRSADPDGTLLRAALLGAGAWPGFLLLGRFDLATALLLLGPLVAVPLGLRAAPPATSGPLWRGVRAATFPAALLAAVAFARPAGPMAAGLVAPWTVVTGVLALLALHRLPRPSRPARAAGLATGLAPVLLAVGGAWALASRAGLAPIGFGEPLVTLTAAHFHFAGYVLPVLAGLATAARPGRVGAIACVGVLLGVPLVAAGITVGKHGESYLLEWLAAWLLSGAAALVAVQQLRLAARDGLGLRGGLWILSGASLLVGMAFAAAYGLDRHLRANWLDVGAMLRLHAAVNVFGFALPGLLAWTDLGVVLRRTRRPPPLADLEPWERRDPGAEAAAGPGPRDHCDVHARDAGRERPGDPEPDGPHRRAAAAVLRYDIFPPALLSPLVRRTPLEVGDTVGARYPTGLGLDLVFASRVVATFDGREGDVWRTGFTHRTLPGHPELGEETFAVEKDVTTGGVRVALRAWSRPQGVAGALAPLARFLQLRAGSAAAERLAAAAAPDPS